ncbi:peptide MFS transporter [Sphingomonas sp.]|uniref:peptide MFS transporter n=1 Tax=Sphingomonas sp. TaxID=28214 RepID=UPI000DAFC08A|nr:peptide MFS transporter [Sphingomonas sp.]PZU10119.1 MAG: MFS transporter [Sphingomonas sp.]
MMVSGAGAGGRGGGEAGRPSPGGEDTAFFGHPRGLGYLAGTELWERFSFYGMQSLLMLYMTKYLLLPSVAGDVAGLAGFRAALGAIVGPMSDLAFAAQTFGLYSGFMMVVPLIGSWLGDRVIGRTKTVTLGAVLMAAGHLAMAIEQAFLLALVLLILGGGCLIGNLAAQVGSLYAPEDSRRTRAFGLYLVALNIGAFASPIIVGTLGERVAWRWGFAAAGIGMMLGLLVYLCGRRHLPAQIMIRGGAGKRLGRAQWITIGALAITMVPRIFAIAAAKQAYSIMLVWADGSVDRHVGPWEVPVTWIMSVDGMMTIIGILLVGMLWARLGRRGLEPSDVRKIGIGNLMVAAAFLMIGLMAQLAKVPLLGWLGFYLLLDLSYAWWDPPGKALISRFAPASVNGTMFAASNLATAGGFFLLGYLGRYYEALGPSFYFLMTALLPIVGGLFMILFARSLLRLLETADREGAGDVAAPHLARG